MIVLRDAEEVEKGMTLEALRFLIVDQKHAAIFSLRRHGERGFAIRFELRGGFGQRARGWLLAEKSKRVRVFARAETVFGVLRSLGVDSFSVDLSPDSATAVLPRSLAVVGH